MGLMPFLTGPGSPFEAPSLQYQIASSPLQFIVYHLHRILVYLRGAPFVKPAVPIRVVCVSDTHTNTVDLPSGDVLIHAGDLTNLGSVDDIQAQLDWLSSQSFRHVVTIAGNHDSYFDPRSRRPSDKGRDLDFKRVQYLQHSGTTLEFPDRGNRRLKLYGAPQIPACGGDEMAFQYARQDDAWSGTIPTDLDVLITHTPPKYHLDLPVGLGCEYLRREVWKVRPKLHVFGHVHAGRGREDVFWSKAQEAYERIRARSSLWEWIGIRPFTDMLRVFAHGLLGILWSRIWGAEADATVMINAGLVDWRTRLRFGAQIIDI